MSLSSRMRTWWRAMRHGDAVGAQVDEELRFHLERYAEDLMRRGMSREEALRRAKAELGSMAAVRENSREAWGTRWFDELHGDLRYSLRLLARSPGFALIAVGSLALGIGANTVIFTAAQHALLDRLDVPHPEQLRLLEWVQDNGNNGIVSDMWGSTDSAPGGGMYSTSFTYPVYRQLRGHNRSLADICAYKNIGRVTGTIDGQAEGINAEMVSGNYYSTLQVRPQLGRVIQDADDGAPGSGPVATISDEFWARRFGRARDAIGKRILVNGKPMTIVGVNPRGFTGAYSAQQSPDIFLPFSMQPIVLAQSLLQSRSLWWVLMLGRIRPGVPVGAAQAALNTQMEAAIRATMSISKSSQIPRLVLADGSRGQNPNAGQMSRPIWVLLALAGLVLLLACANLANLLLARSAARQREMCVRLAMGAARQRILRQVLTESLLLSITGGMAGVLMAVLVRNALPRLVSNGWTVPAFTMRLDWRILGFTAAISLATGLIFGVFPAMYATRVEVNSGLKVSGQTATRRRTGLAGRAIVVLQVALSMLLVVGAGLFVQTLIRLERSPIGFRTHHLLLFGVDLPESRYPHRTPIPVLQQIEAKLAAVPGVQSVTLTRISLMDHGISYFSFTLEGKAGKPDGNGGAAQNDVGHDFFSVFQIPILEGRGFDTSDTGTSTKVAVINESFAKKFFPDQNPVGHSFDIPNLNPSAAEGWAGSQKMYSLRIVGVCADAKYATMRQAPRPTFYTPYEQAGSMQNATFGLATLMPTSTLLPSLRNAVASVDHNLPLLDMRTEDEQIAANLQQEHILANLTGAFGVLALLLACIGIYGITAYSVSQRTNEIGIRMALGAEPGRVLRMVLREASWLGIFGVVAGLAGALALGRIVGSLLYGLKAWDPATLAGSAVLLLAVALAAGWIPAKRAAGVDPMRALRHE